MKKVSIVMPAHNEEKRIGETLEKYFDYFCDLKNRGELDFEIIVVLNACKDRTLDVVKKFERKEFVILNFERGGKGFAIIEGFKEAIKRDNELIGFVDADMATPPSAFYALVKHIKNADGIIANRWDSRSKIWPKQSLFRMFLSRGYNFIVRIMFLFNHRDTQCGAKLFKRELLKKIIHKLGSSEWGFDVDLLFYARRENAKISSIPTLWRDKKGSKVNLKKTPITMLLSAIRLRLVHSPLRFVTRAYTKLPESLKIHKRI